MKITSTKLSGALVIEPKVFGDARGFFFESFNLQAFNAATSLNLNFVQDNHSRSAHAVLRGLHYQTEQAQGKLVRVVKGAVLDVAVDLRRSSPSYGQWDAIELSEENQKQFWIPAGFAHGFVVLSESADFLYKTTDYYLPSAEQCIMWNDPALQIDWQLNRLREAPKLSGKDLQGLTFERAPKFT
jgi:dTDP-4-dehydrorhamnose 3,5-epimerase